MEWRLIQTVLILLSLHSSAARLFERTDKTDTLLELLTDSEKIFFFGSADSAPHFHIANFKHNNRRKRAISDPTRINGELDSIRDNLKEKLQPRPGLDYDISSSGYGDKTAKFGINNEKLELGLDNKTPYLGIEVKTPKVVFETETLNRANDNSNTDLNRNRKLSDTIETYLNNEKFDDIKRKLDLKLQPGSALVDPRFLMLRRWQNKSEPVFQGHFFDDVDRCFYRSDRAALYMCDDVRGIINNGDGNSYFIHPLPVRFHTETSKPHVITRKPIAVSNKEEEWRKHRRKPTKTRTETKIIKNDKLEVFKYDVSNDNDTLHPIIEEISYTNVSKTEKVRSKRSAKLPKSAIFVETAVFVDRDLYKHMTINYPSDTERELVRFVLAMINAVQLLYHDPSLGRPVNFILKRLEILHEDPANLKRPHDIDRFLSNFCTWQRLENPHGDNDPLHWDHALILTGLDLYVVSKNGKVSSQVVGLAPVAGMCTVTSSCTVNEGRHFESVYVVAHEIGHNLGMRHDGPSADNNCDPSSYIMSPTLGSGKITWSSCSQSYLQKFLDTIQSRCLLDHSSSAGQLDHSAEAILPGERFDADQQCMLKYGRGSRHSSGQSLEAICRDLHCQRDRYTWTSHPALEGTACGREMWCRSGACVARTDVNSNATPGTWAEWGSWTDCASGCLYGNDQRLSTGSTGIAVSNRRCNRARLEDRNSSCSGHDKKYQTCFAHQCREVPRMTIREFADEICSRAREVDPDLIGTGLQRIENEEGGGVDGCAVWCERRGGGYSSRGWSFPDGTACTSTTTAHYCIAGKCQKFECSSTSDDEFTVRQSECEVEQQKSSPRRRAAPPTPTTTTTLQLWKPLSGCHYRCVRGGLGLRLVAPSQTPNDYAKQTIQLCTPDQKMADMGCSQRRTAYQYATMVCTKYKERVRRLSGVGMQITPALEEPDRACRVACQDSTARNRFYLVNGPEGWLPFGTPCTLNNHAYCVSGKCLEFGPDKTPITEIVFTLPLHSRQNSTYGRSLNAKLRNIWDNKTPTNNRAKKTIGRPSNVRYEHRNIHITEYLNSDGDDNKKVIRSKRSLQRDKGSSQVKATLKREHLQDIIAKLNLSENATLEQRVKEAPLPNSEKLSIDFSNPVHISMSETPRQNDITWL